MPTPRKKLYTPELARIFAQRQEAGETQEEIARDYSVCPDFVSKSLKRAGLAGAWKLSQKKRFAEIHREYESGISITALAKKNQISRQRIYQGFKSYQFKLRPWFLRDKQN